MALDFFAIASQGVYPTPTPTDALRAALAASQGFLNITLPGPPISVGGIGGLILSKIKRMFLGKDIHL